MELCFVFLRTCIRYHVQSAMSSTFYIFFIFLNLMLLFTHHYSARCFGINMPKSRDIQAKIPLPQAIWNEFWLRYCERSEQYRSHAYFLSNCTSYLRSLFNVTVQYSCTTAVLNSYLRFFQEGNSMTILKCSAMTCVYNKEQLCSKGDIDVTGENATSANETSCGSFRERTGSSMKGSYTDDCGCDKIQIDCKAHNCTYNDNCKCTASSIQVDGSNAHASSDTRCDTFQCHCGA